MHDVGLHHHVVVDEFRRIGIVGVDAAHLRRGQVDLVDALGAEEVAHLGLVGQLQFLVAARDDIGMALARRTRTMAEPTRPLWPAT
jgi:hypothetical protein